MSPSPEAPVRVISEREARNERVLAHLDLVERYVRRYASRGVPREDLRQAGYLALVEAAQRFDPERGDPFEGFAAVTIDGTMKRYFRDRTWVVRPPRALVEVHLRVRRADEDLRHRLGRRPTIAELADEVGVDEDTIYHALEVSGARWCVSLDTPSGEDGATIADGPWLGRPDPGFGHVEARSDLRDAMARLGPEERELIRLRFVEGLTQQEISDILGLSQSYVSRIIRGVLRRLEAHLGADLEVEVGRSGSRRALSNGGDQTGC